LDELYCQIAKVGVEPTINYIREGENNKQKERGLCLS
jgi:hypothetical protein